MTASANVPPQGKSFRVSRDQMQMGLNILTTDKFSSHLHLIGNRWQLSIHMITFQSKCFKISQVTLTAYHDTVAMVLHALTRSVGVSYLSQYLQHPTLTGDIPLKYFNHLITFVIVKPAHIQLRPTLQILRHTRLATGTNPRPIGTIDRPVASPGNVTYLNCRAVMLKPCQWLLENFLFATDHNFS